MSVQYGVNTKLAGLAVRAKMNECSQLPIAPIGAWIDAANEHASWLHAVRTGADEIAICNHQATTLS